MSELGLLVVALLALWIHESAIRVPAGWFLFWGGDRGPLSVTSAPRGPRAVWRIAQLWPLFGRAFLVPDGPFEIGGPAEGARPGPVAWKVRTGRDAQAWTAALTEGAGASSAPRGDLLRARFEESTDLRAIRHAAEDPRGGWRMMRLLGALQFVLIAAGSVILGVLGRFRGFAPHWILLVLAIHVVLVAAAYRRSRLAPTAGAGLWMLALSPLAALRAGETLRRLDLARFDPNAVALVLASAAEFRRVAGESLRALAADRRRADDPGDAGLRAAITAREAALDRLLRAAGITRAQVEDAAPVHDASARSYCPSCGAAYALEAGECTECAGVRLVRLNQDRAAAWRRALDRISRRQVRARR